MNWAKVLWQCRQCDYLSFDDKIYQRWISSCSYGVPVVKCMLWNRDCLEDGVGCVPTEEVLWMPVRAQEVNGDGHVSMKKCVHKIEICCCNNIFKEPKRVYYTLLLVLGKSL